MRWFGLLGSLASFVLAGALLQAPAISTASASPGQAMHGASQPSGNTLAAIQKQGVIRVGVALNAPWALRDKNNQWQGLDVDLMQQLARDMRWKVELVPTTWPTAIEDLRAGRFDVLAAGLSVTPQRALLVKYSRPYGAYALSLVVNRKALGKDDLLTLETGSGKHSIAVLSGTVTASAAKELVGNSDLIETNDEAQAIQDLRNGKLDGLLAEQPLPAALAHTYPDQLQTLDVSTYGKTAHAFAVRRDDQDLLDVINAWLISQDAAGWIQSREQFWIHSPNWVELM
jgi:polar amino acid transport system substrate-binding protein